MICGKCGTFNGDTARFCSACGQELVPRQETGERNEVHQLPVGTVLRSRYRVGKTLGQGGFGITYLGYDTLMETQVAIKEFYPGTLVSRNCAQSLAVTCHSQQHAGSYRASLDRFLREAKALVKFRNIPEVVDILDFVEENNTAYIIMEYVQGMSLVQYIAARGGRLAPEETFRILKPVMEALATVHGSGIVHRDIAPDNIILHPMGGAKLLDFGAVRAVESADAEAPLAKSTEAILKHGFAPIEQYNTRGSLGPWTDEYAMCATVYYCLTGTVPPEASLRISEGVDPEWDTPGLTAAQKAALEKGMAMRAKDRYPDMRSLLDALFPAPAASDPAPKAAPKAATQPKAAPKAAPQPQAAPKAAPKAVPKPAAKSQPAAKPQPKPAPGKQKGSDLFTKLAVIVVVALGGFFALMALWTTVISPPTTTLAEEYILLSDSGLEITLFDGIQVTRRAYTADPETRQDLWNTLSGVELREVKSAPASFSKGLNDTTQIALSLYEDDQEDSVFLGITESGDMWVSRGSELRYFSGGAEIYRALDDCLPLGAGVRLAKALPEAQWTGLRIDIRSAEGSVVSTGVTGDPEKIGSFMGSLSKWTVQYGGGLYGALSGDTLSVWLFQGNEMLCCIELCDDGNGELVYGLWEYGICDTQELYAWLCDAMRGINDAF